MEFYCKDCDTEFIVDDKECEGYYNWKCPDCNHIAMKKDSGLGLGIIWKCDTGTTKRESYKPPKTSSCGSFNEGNKKCAACPSANA